MNRVSHAIWHFFWKLRSKGAKGLQKGDIFPEFSLRDSEGRLHSLSDILPEKKVALWFTNFCEDCRAKIPLLEELNRIKGERIGVLAVSLLGNDLRWPKEYAHRISFPILIDPDDIVGRHLGLSHPPGTCPLHNLFVLDKQGRILLRHHLSALSEEAFRDIWQQTE